MIIFILLYIGESPHSATKATKMILFDMMELTVENTFCVEKLPTRSNICYYFNYIDKNLELETVFKDSIEEV